jgi:hypothetical protein
VPLTELQIKNAKPGLESLFGFSTPAACTSKSPKPAEDGGG